MFKPTANALSRFSLLFAVTTLAACGGSSGGGSGSSDDGVGPEAEPGSVATAVKPGIFNSTITYESGAIEPARTLISSSGEYAIYTTQTLVNTAGMFGTLMSPDDNTFSDDSATYVFLDGTWQPANGSLEGEGDASSLEQFTATLTAEPDVGVVRITGIRLNELSNLQVTLQNLSETYSQSTADGVETVAVTIHADGTVTGSTADCVINSNNNVPIRPDPTYNIFEAELSITNCAPTDEASSEQRNGVYTIVGFLRPSPQGTKQLAFAGTNGELIFSFIGTE